MISILVITYNQSKYISKCIESIIMQKVDESIEILVGDDCSTDGTSSIILDYALKYPEIVRPIIRRSNVGATKNLFDLLKRAKGRYVAFCEGDDYWICDKKLEIQKLFLDLHTKYSASVHRTVIVDEFENKINVQNISWIDYRDEYELSDYDALRLPAHLSSLMVRNNQIYRDDSINVMLCDKDCSDKVVFLLALVGGKIKLIDKTFSAYRFVRDSANNVITAMYSTKKSRAFEEMNIIVNMEKWINSSCGIKQYFIKAQCKWIITAVYQKIKNFDVSIFDIWNICNHKILCLTLIPIVFIYQVRERTKIMCGEEIR